MLKTNCSNCGVLNYAAGEVQTRRLPLIVWLLHAFGYVLLIPGIIVGPARAVVYPVAVLKRGSVA